jgi:cupin domain
MNRDQFRDSLARDGFAEIEEKHLPAGTHNEEHAHPFEVRALVLEGRIALTVDDAKRVYEAGQVFTMAPGCRHVEDVGPAGVRYLVGRKR